jgi:tRNA1Val (adenine37-N6)-methyltransferase
MANTYFQFKQFTVHQDRCAMKVTTDSCLFGAWVADCLLQKSYSGGGMLDIGTGTGLLSLMVRQAIPATIDAVDIDGDAAQQAVENVSASPFSSIRVRHAGIETISGEPFDVIFSNPPFYENALASPDAGRDAAHHGSALRWRSLFPLIAKMLADDGLYFLLLPASREAEAMRLLVESGLFIHCLVRVRQTPAHPVFRLLIEGGKRPAKASEEAIIIRDGDGNYTAGFAQLLAPYYLYL